jgi:uncharacterized membrane protein
MAPVTDGAAGRARRALPWLAILYGVASLLHFTHNAEYLAQYPNLPASWTRADVYVAWCALTVLGLLGYALYVGGKRAAGLSLLALYAVSGFAGLLHYTRAPMAHHSGTMNATIWTEVITAAALLLDIAILARCARARPA